MNNAYIKLKGFAIAIAMGLLVYLVLNGVRLAKRYMEAKELETRYYYVEKSNIIIDKKEKKLYKYNRQEGGFTLLKQ